ncbi:S8 family peptidase [Pseudogulbenkiania subflava]|uniref:Subtilase family protein n=1 Tax=Pseudogulbenkiania subflava DSM 22618 TaxID=1123014 RepID=A0A1Y6BKP1_9NEIS|nr:S8 family peptidase [Pseudogulbenkiania subflava]SMF08504.1 Subtilase family protein [Pseudogulbenkiania subflava DSM 22618]
MSEKVNFILGRGESLALPVAYQNRDGRSAAPYSWEEQKDYLLPLLQAQTEAMDELRAEVCPGDQAVSKFTLHPQYYSRSAFPEKLLHDFGLRLVGSKPVKVKPRAGRGSDTADGAPSTAIFVAGPRTAFKNFALAANNMTLEHRGVEDLIKLENVELMSSHDRLMGTIEPNSAQELEIVVHFDSYADFEWEQAFFDFAKKVGVQVDAAHNYQTRGLLFLPATGNAEAAQQLAEFSFIRAIRPMPKFRFLEKPAVIRAATRASHVYLPTEGPVDPDCTVAVFDGGLRADHPFGPWATLIEPSASDQIGDPVPSFQDHGTAVTSAVLFGHVESGHQPRPYCAVDHYRVLGDKTTDRSLYSVMLYVDKILSQSNYAFASFSFGPYEVAGDDLVTAWTAMLDDHLGSGDLLATVAVGNEGHQPWPHCRIMIPSDSVNALAVGASDSIDEGWQRAPYSSIGPGRHPGTVKPDVVYFGGVETNPFRFIFPGPVIAEDCGTSYATPAVMRIATGLRAFFGSALSPLAIRTLMLHCATSDGHSRDEVGWGAVPTEISDITVCKDGSVRILYQGKLKPGKVLRAPIPMPEHQLSGEVTISATFCYTCATDPHTPGDYTRAGLEVTFRPHSQKFDKDPQYPASCSFFKRYARSNEQDLRFDAHKWDTVMHNSVTKRGSSLFEPVFDVHYLARKPGEAASPYDAVQLSYALVVTVHSPKTGDLYDKVLARFANRLSVIRPRLELPIPVGTTVRRGE